MSAAISSAHAVSGSVATLRSRRAIQIRAVRSIKDRAEAEKPNFKGWKDIDIKQVQLGTAKIPSGIDEEVFCSSLYQWANGLTTSGQNMPFALPQRVDRLPSGFSMAFLVSDPKGEPGTFVSCGEIIAEVVDHPLQEGQRVLIINGTGQVMDKGRLIDVDTVMQTFPNAIRNAVGMATKD